MAAVHLHGLGCFFLVCVLVSFGALLRLFKGRGAAPVVLVGIDEGPSSSSDCTSLSDELISLGSALPVVN